MDLCCSPQQKILESHQRTLKNRRMLRFSKFSLILSGDYLVRLRMPDSAAVPIDFHLLPFRRGEDLQIFDPMHKFSQIYESKINYSLFTGHMMCRWN